AGTASVRRPPRCPRPRPPTTAPVSPSSPRPSGSVPRPTERSAHVRTAKTFKDEIELDATPPADPPRVARPGHVLHRYVTGAGYAVNVECREHSPEDHFHRRETARLTVYRARRAEIHAAIEAREDGQ